MKMKNVGKSKPRVNPSTGRTTRREDDLRSSSKGVSHIDFVVAAGLFIVVFVIVVQSITNYLTTAENTAEINALTGRSLSLLDVADHGFFPENWTGNETLERLGLSTRTYRFYVLVNNSKERLYNQSQNVTDIASELVSFDYVNFGFGDVDINSTTIYDSSENLVPYSIQNTRITFSTPVLTNETKYFLVYFDDDSNFTNRSAVVSGSDLINESFQAVYALKAVQYRKLQALGGSNYTLVSNSTGTGDFRIAISDLATGTEIFSYGGEVPRRGNVVALQRYVVYQNSTAGVRTGKLIAQTW